MSSPKELKVSETAFVFGGVYKIIWHVEAETNWPMLSSYYIQQSSVWSVPLLVTQLHLPFTCLMLSSYPGLLPLLQTSHACLFSYILSLYLKYLKYSSSFLKEAQFTSYLLSTHFIRESSLHPDGRPIVLLIFFLCFFPV